MAEAEKRGAAGMCCGGKADWFSLILWKFEGMASYRPWRTVLGLLRAGMGEGEGL